MRRIARWAALAAVGLGGLPTSALANKHEGHEGEEKGEKHEAVTLDQLPPAVRSTLEKEAQGGGKIEELKKETEHGEVRYDAEVVKGSRGTDLEISQDGKVLSRSRHNEAAERKKGEE